MTVFGSKVLKAYVILMWSGAVPWWGGGGGGRMGGTGASPPPPPPPPGLFFFFFYIYLFICFVLFVYIYFLVFFPPIYFFFFFYFFACQLRAQSCTLMIIIPLTHYDKFVHKIFQVGENMSRLTSPPPPRLSDLFKMWIGYPIVFCYCIRR